jgi:urease accessory protein
MSRRTSAGVLSLAALLLSSGSAFAHHAMDYQMPQTFVQGLLSGFGHPIIGPDHLAFILAIGLIGTLFARGYLLPLAFVAATLAGCAIHLAEWNLPVVEPVVSGTVILGGALLALYRAMDVRVFAGFMALAGLFHGYAYGESIVGAETTPLAAYLIGFAVIQAAIALAAFGLGKALLAKRATAAVGSLRVFGGLIAAAGVYFFASALVA